MFSTTPASWFYRNAGHVRFVAPSGSQVITASAALAVTGHPVAADKSAIHGAFAMQIGIPGKSSRLITHQDFCHHMPPDSVIALNGPALFTSLPRAWLGRPGSGS